VRLYRDLIAGVRFNSSSLFPAAAALTLYGEERSDWGCTKAAREVKYELFEEHEESERVDPVNDEDRLG